MLRHAQRRITGSCNLSGNHGVLVVLQPKLGNVRMFSFAWGPPGGSGGSGDGNDNGGNNKDKDSKPSKDAAEENTQSSTQLIVSEQRALKRTPIGEHAPMPSTLMAVPIARRPVFPGFMAPLVISDEKLVEQMQLIKESSQPYIGLFLVKDPAIDLQMDKFSLTSMNAIHNIGVMAHIQQLETGPMGAIAMVMAHRRIRAVSQVSRTAPPLMLQVEHIRQPSMEEITQDKEKDQRVKAMVNEILTTLRDIVKASPLFQQHIAYFARKIDVSNPYALADFAASLTTLDAKDLQDLLETFDLEARLNKALIMLKKEQTLAALQMQIKQDVEKKIDKQQRQYFLQEQLKSIKKELGMEKDDKETLINKFNERITKVTMPATAKQVFDEEMEKLSMLERNSSEFNVTRSYLDWLTSLPWGKYSTDNYDTMAARKILDEDHYGMQDVKDRILEFIAVGKLKGSVQGKILCLVGPPGVGKTSIGKSIARSLSRQFYRFSVGGLSDVAEIKGHRRTYIGAMPGKLIQCLKSTGVSNPLILIDEIDKIGAGRGYSGDPSSALLELLDPNQNAAFMDHYLDTPVDASKILFIATANSLDTIPGPLLDRMEIIRLSGYDAPEKVQIVKRYLEPKTRGEMGLESDKATTPKSLVLKDEAVEHLIRWYARESGVRNLEKLIGKIFRKAASKIVAAREKVLEEMKKLSPAAEAVAATAAPSVPPASAPATVAASSEPSATVPAEAAQPAAASSAASNDRSINDTTGPLPGEQSQHAGGAGDGTPATPADAAAPTSSAAPSAAAEAAPKPAEPEIPLVEDAGWTITAENLEEFVGKAIFTSDRLYDVPPVGVAQGLAWTSMGGSALYIEVASPYTRSMVVNANEAGRKKRASSSSATTTSGTTSSSSSGNPVIVDTPRSGGASDGTNDNPAHQDDDSPPSEDSIKPLSGVRVISGGESSSASERLPSGGSLRVTGKMGEVMQESAQIAYTLSRRFLRSIDGQDDNDYLDTTTLHMHVPEGATPKDGPSAGITMTTALLSAAMDKPIRPDLAMTGEVDLIGTVLPVGGIKEKTMAARRAGVTCLVFPKANKRDFDELPSHLKDGLEVHFASQYEQVYKVAFDYSPKIVQREAAKATDPAQHPAHVELQQQTPQKAAVVRSRGVTDSRWR